MRFGKFRVPKLGKNTRYIELYDYPFCGAGRIKSKIDYNNRRAKRKWKKEVVEYK